MPIPEEKAKDIVNVAAQIARAQNAEPEATLLENCSASLVFGGEDFDVSLYTLTLEVPIRTYANIEQYRDGLEQSVRERIRPIVRRYPDSRISEVIITPELSPASRPPAVPPKEGEEAEDTRSFWKTGFFRLFISHTSPNKISAHNLKAALPKYRIAAFVAHDDIDPTKEWQLEIERALRTADSLAAIITPDFIESRWCDQEVGFAFGRGKLVVPLCKESVPHGFLGKYQGFQARGPSREHGQRLELPSRERCNAITRKSSQGDADANRETSAVHHRQRPSWPGNKHPRAHPCLRLSRWAAGASGLIEMRNAKGRERFSLACGQRQEEVT